MQVSLSNVNTFAVMALAGALLAWEVAFRLDGAIPILLSGSAFRIDYVGFDAIGVALLGRTTAIGVFFAALLFGGLRQGAGLMQLNANVPGDLVYIIQAFVLFSIAADFLTAIRHAWPRRLTFRRKPSLATAGGDVAIVDLPGNGNVSSKGIIDIGSQAGDLTGEKTQMRVLIADLEMIKGAIC